MYEDKKAIEGQQADSSTFNEDIKTCHYILIKYYIL